MLRVTILAVASLAFGLSYGHAADEARIEACKAAMNQRIQVCTDECTSAALTAAPSYKDVNNNVKFGCLKGCALRQVFQMQVCRDGGKAGGGEDPTETNK